MRGRNFTKGIAAALIMTLAVSVAVPGLATETGDVQPEEEMQILSETEAAAQTDEGNVTEDISDDAVEPETVVEEPDENSEDTEDTGILEDTYNDVVDEDENINELSSIELYSVIDIDSISISYDKSTLNVVGQTAQPTVTIEPEDAEYASITWSSSNTSVVNVDQSNGLITAGSTNGTATITAAVTEDDGTEIEATCSIKVDLYNGLYQDPDGSDWYYYTKGVIDTGKTLVVDATVNGTKGQWNVVNGKLKRATDVVKYNGDWWYFNANGMLDTTYDGFATNSNGSWLMEGGRLERDENGVIKDKTGALGSTSDYYYVLNSKVQYDFTGLANYSNSSGWWYITKGKVDRTYNGLAKNKNGWYYLTKGKVDRSYTGFSKNSSGNWYVKAGTVAKTVNGVFKDTTGAIGSSGEWYYVLNNKVQTSFTGLANYSNASGWWYITNGKVDRTYQGLAKNKNGWFYLTKGKVDRSYTGFAKNSKGDWYVEKGKVTKSTTSVVKDTAGVLGTKGTWYYISGSKVQYGFTGIATNSNGSWYIKNGKLDRSFTGTYNYKGATYDIKNGKVITPYAALGMSETMYNKAQSQSSSTKWLIMVDVTNCRFGIFQGSKGSWTPYKCWDCTTGAPGSPTCIGSYTIYGKGKSFGDSDHTCYWYSQFNGNYLIHSILYYPGTMTVKSGQLGAHLSNGCVRLSYDNAKWVYDNIPYNTRVVTYK